MVGNSGSSMADSMIYDELGAANIPEAIWTEVAEKKLTEPQAIRKMVAGGNLKTADDILSIAKQNRSYTAISGRAIELATGIVLSKVSDPNAITIFMDRMERMGMNPDTTRIAMGQLEKHNIRMRLQDVDARALLYHVPGAKECKQTAAINRLGKKKSLEAAGTLIAIAKRHPGNGLFQLAIETATEVLLKSDPFVDPCPIAISEAMGMIAAIDSRSPVVAEALARLSPRGTGMMALHKKIQASGASIQEMLHSEITGYQGNCLATKNDSQPPMSEARLVFGKAIELLGEVGDSKSMSLLLGMYADFRHQAPESLVGAFCRMYARGLGGKETIAAALQVAYFNGMDAEHAFRGITDACKTDESLSARFGSDMGALKGGKDGWLTYRHSAPSVFYLAADAKLGAILGPAQLRESPGKLEMPKQFRGPTATAHPGGAVKAAEPRTN